jgi:hypothetical protein
VPSIYDDVVNAGVGYTVTRGDAVLGQTLIDAGTGAELDESQQEQMDSWEENPLFKKRIDQILRQIQEKKKLQESAGLAEGGLVEAENYEDGGEVEGPGTGTSDSIEARLSDGEFVFTAKAVEQIGADNLMAIMKEAEKQYDKRTSESEARSLFGKMLRK